jgi:hypothetical protein
LRPFSNVISIKTSRAAQKINSNMAATVGKVIDDVTCKSSIEDLQWRHAMTSSTDVRHIGPKFLRYHVLKVFLVNIVGYFLTTADMLPRSLSDWVEFFVPVWGVRPMP